MQQSPNQSPENPYQQSPQQPWPPQPSKKRRRWLWIVGAIILVIIVIGAIVGFAASRGSFAKWTTTHSLTDSGNVRTDIITVLDDWKITWQCYPAQAPYDVKVDVYNSSGVLVSTAIDSVCHAAGLTGNPTSGEYEMHIGGQVFLYIQSEGQWTVQVQELK